MINGTPSPNHEENLEVQLREIARHLTYPPTPDIAGGVYEALRPARYGKTASLWLRLGSVAVMLGFVLMLVPGIRAEVLDSIRERLGDSAVVVVNTQPTAASNNGVIDIKTPQNVQPYHSILDLPGEIATNLGQARSVFGQPFRLPTYPEDLGSPDVVYMLRTGNPYVIAGWFYEDDPTLEMSLHMVDSSSYVTKEFFDVVKEDGIGHAQVNGRDAYWLTSPHQVTVYASNSGRLDRYSWDVSSNVLIWTVGQLTYRLETILPLDRAILVAESLQ